MLRLVVQRLLSWQQPNQSHVQNTISSQQNVLFQVITLIEIKLYLNLFVLFNCKWLLRSSTEVAVDDNLPKKETAVSFRDPHSLSIQDSDLMEHDYDFIDYVAPKSDCEQAKEKQADLSNDKWRRTMTRLYAMDRLNAEAKLGTAPYHHLPIIVNYIHN